MHAPETVYAKIAFETILFVVKTGELRRLDEKKVTADLKLQTACIITAENVQTGNNTYAGSLYPQTAALYEELLKSARELAEGKNGKAIEENELSDLKIQVHVVSRPEKVEDFYEIKPGKGGVCIRQDRQEVFILPSATKKIKSGIAVVEALLKKGKVDKTQPFEVFTFRTATYE